MDDTTLRRTMERYYYEVDALYDRVPQGSRYMDWLQDVHGRLQDFAYATTSDEEEGGEEEEEEELATTTVSDSDGGEEEESFYSPRDANIDANRRADSSDDSGNELDEEPLPSCALKQIEDVVLAHAATHAPRYFEWPPPPPPEKEERKKPMTNDVWLEAKKQQQ